MKNDAISRENKRLHDLLKKAEVPAPKIEGLEVVIDNLSWQRVKLEETRDAIKNSQVVIPYDNGGGQKGLRENPLYKGYLNLWRGYIAGLEKLLSYLPAELQDQVTNEAETTLAKVIKMKGRKA